MSDVLAETGSVDPTATDVAPETTPPPESAPGAPDVSDKAQKRIDELTRRTRDLEWQLANPKKAPEPVKPLVAPKLEESGYDETKHKQAMDAYYEALIDRRAEEKVEKVLTERETKAQAQARDQAFATEYNKLTPVERDVADKAIVTEFAADLIKESPVGAKIALYLGENADLANQIARLPDKLQAKEIGKLEARLEGRPAQEDKVVTLSKAPPPATRLGATDATVSVKATDAESDKLSDADWLKAREKQLKRR